jgi:site-specific recombinase XerD
MTRTTLGQMIARMGRQAGITRLRVSPHKFRHSVAVYAKLAKVDARTTSALLNHTDLRSLKRYDHVVPGELHAARGAVLGAMRAVMALPSSAVEVHPPPEAKGAE